MFWIESRQEPMTKLCNNAADGQSYGFLREQGDWPDILQIPRWRFAAFTLVLGLAGPTGTGAAM
jgi:hypothetical protein